MQKVSPDSYAALALPDQWLEDVMQEYEARWICEQTADCRNVIDLGWGSGIVARALRDAGRAVLVVEGSEQNCRAARAAHIACVQELFEEFEPDGRYDCTIASFVLEHVADPIALLKRAHGWTERLVVVVGNAASWHRRLAVQMGLQPTLETLSARDHAVGHYLVYDHRGIQAALGASGWRELRSVGLMLKPLPNAMMAHFDERLIRAMCEVKVPLSQAANIGICCERL